MKFDISFEAREAIARGIERQDTIADLEDVLDSRVIETLDNHGIIFVEDLAFLTLDQLASIPSIGVSAINQILDALCNYEKLNLKELA